MDNFQDGFAIEVVEDIECLDSPAKEFLEGFATGLTIVGGIVALT